MNAESTPKCPQCGAPLPPDAPDGLCPKCVMALNLKTETIFSAESAPPQAPLTPEQIAPHFPQLEILEYLGRGGMGVVYKARQKSLNRLVALKLLAPERVHDPEFAARFTREAQALAALNHPNIVTIHDFGRADLPVGLGTDAAPQHRPTEAIYYFVMEFVDGVNLRHLLRARKFTPEEALAVVPPLCDALQYAHERGIVHRDIKPENILLDKAGRVKVADFGIAKIVGTERGSVSRSGGDDSSAFGGTRTEMAGNVAAGHSPAVQDLTEAHQTFGTPGYSAPEQKTDPQRVDSRADIYSLGVVFYEMLTGELPGKRIEPPSKKVAIDVRLDEIVLRALETKPELRYQQASVLKTQVETIAESSVAPGTNQHNADSGWKSPDSGWGWLVGRMFGVTFTSLATYRVANASAIGFLGFLGFIPGGRAFFGFFGFFGLAGLAFILESLRRNNTAQATAPSPAPPADFKCPITMEKWLTLMDTGEYGQSWDVAAQYFQKQITKEDWVKRLERVRRPLGEIRSRKAVSIQNTVFGSRYEAKYLSAFDGLPTATETVTYAKQFSGEWLPIGYLIKPAEEKTSPQMHRPWQLVVVALLFIAIGIPSIYSLGKSIAHGAFPVGLDSGLLFIPVGVGLLRLRPWWRKTALFILLLTSVTFVIGGIFALSGVQLGPPPGAVVFGYRIQNELAGGFINLAMLGLTAWQYMVLVRPDVKALFNKRGFSRPLTEWAVLLGGVAVAAVCFAITGHASSGSISSKQTTAEFHYRVFEVDAGLVDRLIPAGQRQRGVQSTAKAYLKYEDGGGSRMVDNGTNSFKVTISTPPETESWRAEISPETLTNLLNGVNTNIGVLAQGTQNISSGWWPAGMATSWIYTASEGLFSKRHGSAGINLAFREIDGRSEIRIEGKIRHETDPNLIVGTTSKILYEGPAPKNRALVFLVPFFRNDDSEHYLVVIYEITRQITGTMSQNLSASPSIDQVNTTGNKVVIEGRATAGARISCYARRPGNGWSCRFPEATRFTATIIQGASGLDCRVQSESGEPVLTMDKVTTIGDLNLSDGTLDFHENRLWREADGSWSTTFGTWTGKSGQNVLIGVNLSATPASPAASLSTGPIIERSLESGNPSRRALNLTFGNYIEPGSGHPLDFSPGGTNSLRAAGVDLYVQDNAPASGVLTTLDMRLCVGLYPQANQPEPTVDSLGAEEIQLAMANLENWRSTIETVRIPGFDLRRATGSISGRNLYLFITRNDVRGVLQITGFTENPPVVKIRYKLVQGRPRGPELAARIPRASEQRLAELRKKDEFQFRWVAAQDDTNSPVDELTSIHTNSAGIRVIEHYRVLRDVFLSSRDVESAGFSQYQTEEKTLEVFLKSEGREKFSEATEQNIKRQLAIVWRGKVLSAPTVQSKIPGGRVRITANFSDAEAQELLDVLNHRITHAKRTDDVSAALVEEPKLQFLAWQDEWQTNAPFAARHPDGSAVTNQEELDWLRAIPFPRNSSNPGDLLKMKRNALTGEYEKDSRDYRVLNLWFAHPQFDDNSLSRVDVLIDGQFIPTTIGAGFRRATAANGNLGWECRSVLLDGASRSRGRGALRLSYTAGPMEKTWNSSANEGVYAREGDGYTIAGIGNTADGKASISFALDLSKMSGSVVGAMAVTKNGKELQYHSWKPPESGTTGVATEKFEFDAPLADVAKFIIGTRPIRTMEWTDVMLPK